MATLSGVQEREGMQVVPTNSAGAAGRESLDEISRQLMRVKILYTFDDENKSNCLARVPHALHIPTVFLDEDTQLGVVELKTCIQAIVAASPELVAKLGHDYTVYAYDYSEYETPLVGQGLLSRILASASPTPKAPADQSQTMVTGRVCKNILGIFSNGVKETLEVKLKLIPVPTCMQKEYVENMERYHSLSQLMPDGFDYSAWSEFLRENPTIGQLTQATTAEPSLNMSLGLMGNTANFSQLVAATTFPEHSLDSISYGDDSTRYAQFDTRPSSPAMSVASYVPNDTLRDSRPASRASFLSEPAHQFRDQAPYPILAPDHQDEGPPKKRARTTKTARPRKAALGANNDSLRVTASTAASVRLHRPVATNTAAEIASLEQGPRAPTPRPGNRFLPHLHHSRSRPIQSSLRHASMDEGRPHMPSFDSGIFSDNAIDSADDERGNSPGDTPMDIPSSPPVMPNRMASSAPSSPGLPAMPYPNDSGFGSEAPLTKDDDDTGTEHAIVSSEPKLRRKRDRSHVPWTEVNPGPMELLPKSYVPKPKAYPRSRSKPLVDTLEKVIEEQKHDQRAQPEFIQDTSCPPPTAPKHTETRGKTHPDDRSSQSLGTDSVTSQSSVSGSAEPSSISGDQHVQSCGAAREQPEAVTQSTRPSPHSAPVETDAVQPASRSATPNPAPRRSKATKTRGLPRSHTWSGEPVSDSAAPLESNLPRSGSGAKRKQDITVKLNQSILAGEMPTYCNNCGEIETPTWRKAYTRVEEGSPTDVQTSSEGTGIVAFEILEPTHDGDQNLRYRIFKQSLAQQERDSDTFTVLTLCNPCGLWLNKKNAMRPRQVWEKTRQPEDPDKPKKKRKPRARKPAKNADDNIFSDAIVPSSEPVVPAANVDSFSSVTASDANQCASTLLTRASVEPSESTSVAAAAALHRAIQSSPPGFLGTRNSPIDLEPDLTPKPTRRLLFPSPRRHGECKSLEGSGSVSPSAKPGTLKTIGLTMGFTDPKEDLDKENCPPAVSNDDDLSHLFEEPTSPKTTPTRDALLQDLLKTPTSISRRRAPLTPKCNADHGTDRVGLSTPSRHTMTPNRSGRGTTIPPETPFTRQLNALLSDCISSPSQAIDFSAFPAITLTPRSSAQFNDFVSEDFLSSDMPMPSSPPGALNFNLYEDPATSTVGLWSGASVFGGSDPLGLDDQDSKPISAAQEQRGSPLKTSELPIDFASMIAGVVSGGSNASSPEENQTPEAPQS